MMVANKEANTRKRKKKTKPSVKSPEPSVDSPEPELDDMGADDFMAMIGADSPADGADDSADEANVSTGPEGIKVVEKQDDVIDDVIVGTTSAKQHKQEIQQLEQKDSDFYQFLKDNDPELLNFSGDSGSEGGSESDSGEEGEAEGEAEGEEMVEGKQTVEGGEMEEESKTSVAKPVTKALIRKWEAGLGQHSVAVWKQLTKAFHAAVSTARGDDPDSSVKYIIIDPDMVNRVIMLSLSQSGPLLAHHLGKNPSAAPKWSKVRLSLKTYLGDLMELLSLLTSDDVLCAVMRHAKECLPYYACYSRLMKKFVKSNIAIWGSKGEMARVVAFTCLQQLVTKNSKFLEEVLKKMYTGTNIRTSLTLNHIIYAHHIRASHTHTHITYAHHIHTSHTHITYAHHLHKCTSLTHITYAHHLHIYAHHLHIRTSPTHTRITYTYAHHLHIRT